MTNRAATSFAIDLDALGNSRPLWNAWIADAARVLPLDPATLGDDRAAAAAALDAAGGGNWRVLLERFAEDHAPVHLRPSAEVSAALRCLAAVGPVGVHTDAPLELASVVLAHLGAARRVTHVQTGPAALDLLLAQLGEGAERISARDELLAQAAALAGS